MSRQKKKVIVLSDNDLLYRAIEVNLGSWFEIEVSPGPVEESADRSIRESQVANVDLIVVAMSLPSGEPLVSLARASLVERIGRVPVLIVSDRPFYASPGERIVHLDFPFRPQELHDAVRPFLDGNSTSPMRLRAVGQHACQ